jgi:hypothetical protein
MRYIVNFNLVCRDLRLGTREINTMAGFVGYEPRIRIGLINCHVLREIRTPERI